MKNVLMIVNPRAGKNSKRINTGDVVRAFKKNGIDCFEKTTTCQGDAIEIARKYASEYDAIACCGGDGTYNEVVNGLMQSGEDKPVLYLPCGSTNDFAASIGIKNDPETAVQMFVDGMLHRFDVGKMNDRYFTYIAAFGVGTDFSYNTSQKFKNMFGHAAYVIDGFILNIVPILKNLKAYHMTVEYDEGVVEDDFYFGAIANTNKIAGLFKMDNFDVKMNDGEFEVLLVRKSNVKGIAEVFFSALRQDYSHKDFVFFKTNKLKITSAVPVDWTLDGEYGGAYTKIEIENFRKAVNLVSPESMFL
ncbi:MAG: diacylglycerol kinase family lipid kinase [Clostridia bacterium]|nr:diacylglycerol kinase family lipid kinase [Clostridia bacterium]